jgi:hypothetical protein
MVRGFDEVGQVGQPVASAGAVKRARPANGAGDGSGGGSSCRWPGAWWADYSPSAPHLRREPRNRGSEVTVRELVVRMTTTRKRRAVRLASPPDLCHHTPVRWRAAAALVPEEETLVLPCQVRGSISSANGIDQFFALFVPRLCRYRAVQCSIARRPRGCIAC